MWTDAFRETGLYTFIQPHHFIHILLSLHTLVLLLFPLSLFRFLLLVTLISWSLDQRMVFFNQRCLLSWLIQSSVLHPTLQEKRSITTENIVAITKSRCNKVLLQRQKVVASRCNKLRGNRFIQQKNLVAINPKYCNEQVDAITSLLQQITLWQ